MAKRLTPLSAKVKNFDDTLPRGRHSVEDRIRALFNNNAGDPDFIQGIQDFKLNTAVRTGSSMRGNDEDIFISAVQGKLADPNRASAAEIRKALDRTLSSEIYAKERELTRGLTPFEDLMGRPQNSAAWKRFKKETGYKGDKWDFAHMKNMLTPVKKKLSWTEIEYVDRNGKKWLLRRYYDKPLGRIVADYYKL